MAKILITVTGSWGTGSFTQVKAAANYLLSLGHIVKVFFPDNKQPCIEDNYYYRNPDIYKIWQFPIEKDGVSLKQFPLMIPDPHPRNVGGITYLEMTKEQSHLFYSELEKELKTLIETFKPDTIISHHIWSMAYVINKLGYQYSCFAHFSDQLGFKYDKTIRKKATLAAKNAKNILCSSNFIRDEVINLYDVDETKVISLFPGYHDEVFHKMNVDKKALFESLKIENIPSKAKIFTFVGSISKTKGFDILLKANKKISEKENIYFIIFGGGDYREVMNSDEMDEYSTKNMFFMGHQPRDIIAKAHNIAKCLLLPSRWEGFGIASLEAMGCSIPVIASSTGGQKEFVVGEIIKKEDSDQLKEAILKIANMPLKEYEKLCSKALEKAKTLTWKKMMKMRLEYF
jgi:glycosyltransferase involved in cell wall biosynthesis